MYKLIALDLDGTLLDDNKRISKENLNTINQLIDMDYEIVIATGRRYWSARELTREINSHITILANNGCVVRNSYDDQVLFSKYLNLEDFRKVMKEGKKRDLHPIIHMNGYEDGFDIIIEFDKDYEGYYDYLRKNNRYLRVENYKEIEDNRILSVVYAGNKDLLRSFAEDIEKKYPNIYSAHVMENIQMAEAILEIMNPEGNKWLSLAEYAIIKNIRPEEIIAIGDDSNDIDMIKNAGLGIAMKNSIPDLKSVAKYISERDNNNSGVAFELKRVFNI